MKNSVYTDKISMRFSVMLENEKQRSIVQKPSNCNNKKKKSRLTMEK